MEKKEVKQQYISASRLINFNNCPYQCQKASYIQAQPQLKGGIVHEMLAAHVIDGEKKAEEILVNLPFQEGATKETYDAAKETWEEYKKRKYLHVEKNKIICVESDDGEEFHHNKKMFGIKMPSKFKGPSGETIEVILRGAMDLVYKDDNDELWIRDWKTGYRESDIIQAYVYVIVAFLKYGKPDKINVEFIYTSKNFTRQVYSFDKDDIAGIYEYLYFLCNAFVNETEWKPRFGFSCPFCEFKLTCPSFLENISKVPEAQQIDPDNFAAMSRWVEHLANVEKAAKKLKEDVNKLQKEYIARKGEGLDHTGQKMVLKERNSSFEGDFDLITQIYDAFGIPVKTGWTFSKSKFEEQTKKLFLAQDFGIELRDFQQKIYDTLKPNTSTIISKKVEKEVQ